MLPIVYGLEAIIETKKEIIIYNIFCTRRIYLADIYNNITFAMMDINENISMFYNELSLEVDPTYGITLVAALILEKNKEANENIIDTDTMNIMKDIYSIDRCLSVVFILSLYMEFDHNHEFIEEYTRFINEYVTDKSDNQEYLVNSCHLLTGEYQKVVLYLQKTNHLMKPYMLSQLRIRSLEHYILIKYPIHYDFHTDNCCICLEDFDDSSINNSTLCCGHNFHHICISSLEKCPLCREHIYIRL
jgi:hypothetical protein